MDWEAKYKEAEVRIAELEKELATHRNKTTRIYDLKEKIAATAKFQMLSSRRVYSKSKYANLYQTAAKRLGWDFNVLMQELEEEGKIVTIPGPVLGSTYIFPINIDEFLTTQEFFSGNWESWNIGIRVHFRYFTRPQSEEATTYEAYWERYGKTQKTTEGRWETDQDFERSLKDTLSEIENTGKLRLTPSETLGTAEEKRNAAGT